MYFIVMSEYVRQSERLKQKLNKICSREGLSIEFHDPKDRHGVIIEDRYEVWLSSGSGYRINFYDPIYSFLSVGIVVSDKKKKKGIFKGSEEETDYWTDERLNDEVYKAVEEIKDSLNSVNDE